MKRLTEKSSSGKYRPIPMSVSISDIRPWENCIERLAEIENILGNEYDLEKLSELLKAKSEGRLFVLEDSKFKCDVKEKAYRYAFALSIFFENDVNDYIYDAVLEKFTRERTEQELEELKNNGLQ